MIPPSESPGAVVVISSHVARSSVGGRVATFALERLGMEVWAAPTVVMAHHPGLGPGARVVPDDDAFAVLLRDLAEAAEASPVAAILSGYLATPAQARSVAAFVGRLKTTRPGTLYLCDPVLGDAGRLYVAPEVAAAIRDAALPLADAATPNLFELGWLTGVDGLGEATPAEIAAQAARLAPVTLVTSAPALMRDSIANILVDSQGTTAVEHRRVEPAAKGTGDLLAALFLGRRLAGLAWSRAAELAAASTFEIAAGTSRAGGEALHISRLQGALVQPRAPVSVRRHARPA